MPYDLVIRKCNAWYTAIKNGRVEQADNIKQEMEK
ncbi:response regulator aspartate phosphatase [Bacillus halotolerans]